MTDRELKLQLNGEHMNMCYCDINKDIWSEKI